MNPKQAVVLRTSLCAVLLFMLLCLTIGADETTTRIPHGLSRPLEVRRPEEQAAALSHSATDSYMADISLEVREVDDFLLTPALLVQEAVSEGVILTYPEE